jgi:YihY family inner membrane protein
MPLISPQGRKVLQHPGAFALQVLKAFQANQGLLLAGAVAYYTLLSIVPLTILMVIGLSHIIDEAELLSTLRRALEHLAPGQGRALVQELAVFLEHRDVIGWLLLITMVFLGSLTFKVLENAISVIFLHRVAKRRRPFIVSALLPFGYMAFLGTDLIVGTLVLARLVAIGEERLVILGHSWSLDWFSRWCLYTAGMIVEILVISSIYWFMPVGRMRLRHALIGGTTAALLWEVVRRVLGWYLSTLSQVSVVYGSFTTTIVVLFSVEIMATLLLLGAQVIAEFERIEVEDPGAAPEPIHTEAVPNEMAKDTED